MDTKSSKTRRGDVDQSGDKKMEMDRIFGHTVRKKQRSFTRWRDKYYDIAVAELWVFFGYRLEVGVAERYMVGGGHRSP